AVPVMAEKRRAKRTGKKTHGINGECLEHADQRIGFWKKQLAKDEAGGDAVEQKIIPFDGGADRAGDHGPAQLGAMGRLVQRTRQDVGYGHANLPIRLLVNRHSLSGADFLIVTVLQTLRNESLIAFWLYKFVFWERFPLQEAECLHASTAKLSSERSIRRGREIRSFRFRAGPARN